MGLCSTVNPNLKGDASVKHFCECAGLDVQGFPEYLSGLVAGGHDLGALSNAQWQQILGPMELGGERAARASRAIDEIRMHYAKDAAEEDAKNLHNHLLNGGAHPNSRPNAEVYEPTLNGARPKPDDGSFVPVDFFQGEKAGWTFKHGAEGLGYYREARAETASGVDHLVATNVSRGYNPVSQAGLEDKMAAQQRAYMHAQSKQQLLLSERRRRLEEQRRGPAANGHTMFAL